MPSVEDLDPYFKLRAAEPTPDAEVCHCPEAHPIVLCDRFSPVPLFCLNCRGEVAPESLGFRWQLAEDLASWRDFARALYILWLDSGEYESWARAQLEDPDGPVNTRGVSLIQQLSSHRRAYYAWIQDNSVDDFAPLKACPRCDGDFSSAYGHAVCEACSLLFLDSEPEQGDQSTQQG